MSTRSGSSKSQRAAVVMTLSTRQVSGNNDKNSWTRYDVKEGTVSPGRFAAPDRGSSKSQTEAWRPLINARTRKTCQAVESATSLPRWSFHFVNLHPTQKTHSGNEELRLTSLVSINAPSTGFCDARMILRDNFVTTRQTRPRFRVAASATSRA